MAGDGLRVHRRHRASVLGYRCRRCGPAFNAFAGTPLAGTPKRPSRVRRSGRAELEPRVLGCTRPGATVNTDQ